MDFNRMLLVLENQIIDFLTMITWWIEVRFDKNNVAVSVMISTLSSLCLFFVFAGGVVEFVNQKNFLLLFVCTSFAFILLGIFFLHIVLTSQLIQLFKIDYPQGTPNPCRVSRKHCLERRMTTTVFLFSLVFLFKDSAGIFLLATLFLICLRGFILACDSLPPKEKVRRRAANEYFARLLQPIPIR